MIRPEVQKDNENQHTPTEATTRKPQTIDTEIAKYQPKTQRHPRRAAHRLNLHIPLCIPQWT